MDINGILTKRGGRFKTWHRRHFELHNNTLSYYTYDGGPLKGEYFLTPDTTIEHSKLRRHCFCLAQKTGRTLYMFADNISDQEMWMNSLNRAIVRVRIQANNKQQEAATSRPRSSTTGHSDEAGLPFQHMTLWELHITVLQARNLAAKGSNNTYAKVVLDTQSSTTRVVKKELSPVWDETFSFVWAADQRYVRVEVWDTDPLISSRDNFLGVVYIPVLSLACGTSEPKWYTLGKRSSRSHVNGEIKILAFSDKKPDENGVKLLRELQSLPELGQPSSAEAFSAAVVAGAECGEDYSREDEYKELIGGIVRRFPVQIPCTETEVVEDIALKVSMKPLVEKTSYSPGFISSDGILVLTNYRLLFVSHSRLAFANEDTSTMSAAMAELTSSIPIAQITSVELNIEQDPLQNSGVLYDSLSVRTNDSRAFSFVFLGMELGVNQAPNNDFKSRKEEPKRFLNRTRSRRSASTGTPAVAVPSQKPRRRTSVTNDSNGTQNISYLEAQTSQEGPPSQRFCFRLQWKIINRGCVVDELKHIHQCLLRAVKSGAGIASSGDATMGREAISYQDFVNAEAEEATLAETVEPFTRDSSTVVDLNASIEHTVDGLRLWVKSLSTPIKYSLYRELRQGWEVYNAHAEFSRLGIPDALWRVSDVNSEYELCATYPALVAVPTSIDDHNLTLASLFRSRGRFPALSWRHPTNYCSLTRSSQPLVGLGQNRSVEDEQLLKAINQASAFVGLGETVNLTTNHKMLPGVTRNTKQVATNERGEVVSPLVIVDARPKINAQANQAVGKGYEMGKAYENCRVIFMGIANIHVMRKSIDALEEACCSSLGEDPNWLKNVDSTGWLQHVTRVLDASTRVAHCITKEAYSVLVHCSDGWDRTAQLTSLSMLMMDPYYRTFEGFQVLIEKEWFAFGHKFCDRLGWREQGWSDDERSPVFHQFLDCVYQCLHQNASIFEFNEEMLLFIATNVLSGWFGNVFANCEKDRIQLRDTSISLWTYVQMNKSQFCNTNYVEYPDVWIPRSSPKNVIIWSGWFLRWHNTLFDIGWQRKNEDFSELHEAPSEWMEDSEVQHCCYCNQRFDFIHRRHHCRACGQIFCESCVKNFRIVHTVSEATPVRVCFTCVQLLDEAVHKHEQDDSFYSEDVGKRGESHKDSTTSIFSKIRSRKSDFSIDNEKFSIDGGSSPDRMSAVSNLTSEHNSARPSLISRVGMMMKSKSTNSVLGSPSADKSDSAAAVEVTVGEDSPRDSEGARDSGGGAEVFGFYPSDRVNEVKLKDPVRRSKVEEEDISAIQSIQPFSSTALRGEEETPSSDSAAQREQVVRGNIEQDEECVVDELGQEEAEEEDCISQDFPGEEEEEEDAVSVESYGDQSTNSEKRVNFALDENSYSDPVEYVDDDRPYERRRPASSQEGRGGSRWKKSTSRPRSHSPPANGHHHRKRSPDSRDQGRSANRPIPNKVKIEKAGASSTGRGSMKKAHSGRYDAFTKPVNLSSGVSRRRTGSS